MGINFCYGHKVSAFRDGQGIIDEGPHSSRVVSSKTEKCSKNDDTHHFL